MNKFFKGLTLFLFVVLLAAFAGSALAVQTHLEWKLQSSSNWSACVPNAACGTKDGTQTRTNSYSCISKNGNGVDQCSPIGATKNETETQNCKTTTPDCEEKKVTWCHTEPNGNHQTLELPQAALQQAGHVDANGNPLHAGDHAGECDESTPTHHACNFETKQCVVVEGAGSDSCTSNEQCDVIINPLSHLACNENHQCVIADGEGSNSCGSDADCGSVPPPPPGGGDGGKSGEQGSFVCTNDKPGTPILISVVVNGPDSVKLTWSPVNGVSDYAIEYGLNSNNYIYGVPHTGNVTEYAIGSLDLSKSYFFRVIALNGCRQGDPSIEMQTAIGGPAVLGLSNTSSSMPVNYILLGLSALFVSSGFILLRRNA